MIAHQKNILQLKIRNLWVVLVLLLGSPFHPLYAHQDRILTPQEIGELRPILGEEVKNEKQIPPGYYNIQDLDKKPRPVRQEGKAKLPSHRNSNPAISVDILILLDSNGTIEEVQIINAPFKKVAQDYVAKIRQWKFSPGELDGEQVKCVIEAALFGYLDIAEYMNHKQESAK